MSLGRFSESLEKARQDKKLNRSRLVASACLLGVALSAAGCGDPDIKSAVKTVGPPPPDVRETPHYGGGSGGSGGGGTT